jgi:hypothetical protein
MQSKIARGEQFAIVEQSRIAMCKAEINWAGQKSSAQTKKQLGRAEL